MANKNKNKGTRAELLVAKWLNVNGHPDAERSRAGWTDDRGDIDGIPNVCIEIKDEKKINLAGYMKELAIEVKNRKSKYGVCIVKKRGTQDAGEWYAVLPAKDWLALLADALEEKKNPDTSHNDGV